MWAFKFKVFDESNIFSSRTKKFNITLYYYPVNHYVEKNNYYFTAIGRIEGSESNKKKFLKDLEKLKKPVKDKRWVVSFDVSGDFFIGITAHTKTAEMNTYVHAYYNPKFIHVKPAIIYPDGWEEAEIAAPRKEDFKDIVRYGKELYNLKVLLMKDVKIRNVGFIGVLPDITDKQKKALELAYKEGYYEYPRMIELEKLAKLMKISLSTYQAHLRKAEKKLLPFMIKRVLD